MSNQNLIPQPDKRLVPVKKFSVKKLLGSTRGRVGALLASVPLWKHIYNLIDVWGNVQMITANLRSIIDFLVSGWGSLILMLLGFALLAWQIRRQVNQPSDNLDNLTAYKLTFEIDALRSKVKVSSHDNETYSVSPELHIRFINSDTHPLFVNKVKVSLIRNENGTESEIPQISQLLTELIYDPTLNNSIKLKNWDNIDLKISERDKTPYHEVGGHIIVSRDYRKLFDSCFLRVTMEAMNQPPYPLDFNVNRENINQGWMGITPRT